MKPWFSDETWAWVLRWFERGSMSEAVAIYQAGDPLAVWRGRGAS